MIFFLDIVAEREIEEMREGGEKYDRERERMMTIKLSVILVFFLFLIFFKLKREIL